MSSKKIPDDLKGQARADREKMIEMIADADDEIATKYLEGRDRRRRDSRRASPVMRRHQARTRRLRLGVQEQGRPDAARRGHRLPAFADRYRGGSGSRQERQRGRAQGR